MSTIEHDDDKPFVWINEAKAQYLASLDPKNNVVKMTACLQRSQAASAIAHNMMIGRGRA